MTSSGVRGEGCGNKSHKFPALREKASVPHSVQTTSGLVRNETGRTLKFQDAAGEV